MYAKDSMTFPYRNIRGKFVMESFLSGAAKAAVKPKLSGYYLLCRKSGIWISFLGVVGAFGALVVAFGTLKEGIL